MSVDLDKALEEAIALGEPKPSDGQEKAEAPSEASDEAPSPATPSPEPPAEPAVAADVPGVRVAGALAERYDEVLNAETLAFLASLHRNFDPARRKLLDLRDERQARYDAGERPGFLAGTAAIRSGDWRIAPLPSDLLDRRTEVTGPPDRRTLVAGLSSGAKTFMADFDDATSPTWANVVEGQLNLMDRWKGDLAFTDPDGGTTATLADSPAVLLVRPRSWHQNETRVTVDGEPLSGALFDAGLYVFLNAKAALAAGSGAYLVLPKLESHLEARLWAEALAFMEERLDITRGSIRTTVMVETLSAAFEMDEIVHALRLRMAALNFGRWDYVFSFVKTLRKDPASLLPDREGLAMDAAFLKAGACLMVRTAHGRGALAIGNMETVVALKGEDAAADGIRAAGEAAVAEGYDGVSAGAPDLVPVVAEHFAGRIDGRNQLGNARADVDVAPVDLLKPHAGARTEAGLRAGIRLGIGYLEAWLRGQGFVPLDGRVEDTATAETARALVWQRLRFGAELDGGETVTRVLVDRLIDEEAGRLGQEAGEGNRLDDAVRLFRDLATADTFEPFLTGPASRLIA